MTRFASWDEAYSALLSRKVSVAEFPAGGVVRSCDYIGALSAAGYDGANAAGAIGDYKRHILGVKE